jgi:hypothetical protein
MTNKNKLTNLSYQLTTIITELMSLLLLNIYIYVNYKI